MKSIRNSGALALQLSVDGMPQAILEPNSSWAISPDAHLKEIEIRVVTSSPGVGQQPRRTQPNPIETKGD